MRDLCGAGVRLLLLFCRTRMQKCRRCTRQDDRSGKDRQKGDFDKSILKTPREVVKWVQPDHHGFLRRGIYGRGTGDGRSGAKPDG